MAQTTIISSIDRSNTYPESILISAPSNCGTIMLTLGGTWTKQMVAELPTINIKMFTIDNEWCKDFNLDIDTSSIFTEDGIAQNATFQLYDIPQSFYLKITPIFDNEALTAHNNTQENGVVSSIKTVNGIVTNDEPDIWTIITNTFDIELVFDDTSIVPGGGGGSATLIEKTITANGEYNASDDSADGYSKVDVSVSSTVGFNKVISYAWTHPNDNVMYGIIILRSQDGIYNLQNIQFLGNRNVVIIAVDPLVKMLYSSYAGQALTIVSFTPAEDYDGFYINRSTKYSPSGDTVTNGDGKSYGFRTTFGSSTSAIKAFNTDWSFDMS